MADRVREALFSSLGATVPGAAVVDLYAGSGSLGLEALSRGAATAVLVERDRAALEALRRNVAAVGLGGEVIAMEVGRFLAMRPGPWDLAFVDPPYALSLASVEEVLLALAPRLAAESIVVLHRRVGGPIPSVSPDWLLADRRTYGDSELWRYATGTAEEDG